MRKPKELIRAVFVKVRGRLGHVGFRKSGLGVYHRFLTLEGGEPV